MKWMTGMLAAALLFLGTAVASYAASNAPFLLGKYSSTTRWVGMAAHGVIIEQGNFYTDVHIFRYKNSILVHWSVQQTPTGRVVGAVSRATVINDHAIAFTIKNDGWGDYGHGRFYWQNNKYVLSLKYGGHSHLKEYLMQAQPWAFHTYEMQRVR